MGGYCRDGVVMSGVPEWAYDRARELWAADRKAAESINYWEHWREAFARYIAAHEEPPVDELLEAVTEAYNEVWAEECGLGGMSSADICRGLTDKLRKRGIEIGQGNDPRPRNS